MSRVLVIGPGAIGGAVAGALADAGCELVLAGRTPFAELSVRHPGGTITTAASFLADPTEAADLDTVVLAVKAHQTAAAAAWITAAAATTAPLYVLQNGVEQDATVRPYVTDTVPVIPTVVQLPSRRAAPGHIEVTGRATLIVPSRAEPDRLAAMLDGSFIEVRVVDDWISHAWVKLMMNAALGGIGVLTRRDNRVFDDPEARDLAIALMEEVATVGRAEGARIAETLPSAMVDRVQAAASGHASSIVVDRRNEVPTEWDVRNAAVGRFGRRHGIPTPLNDLITTLIRLGDG